MANNLTLTSAAFDTAGPRFGSAAISGGYGISPNSLIPTTYPFTLECCVKGASGQAPNAVRVMMGSDKFGFIGCDASNKLHCEYNGSGGLVTFNTTAVIFDSVWHHVALVFDANGGRLYFDGVQLGSSASTYAWDSGNYVNRNIGVRNHANLTNFQWPGEIDEAAVWSTGRYTSGFATPSSAYTGTETGLLALWHLDSNGIDSTGGPAATAYTLVGPRSGTVGASSSSFTVQSNGALASSVTVTPSDGGGGGSFTPSTATLASGANTSATFAYTPGSAGAKTISTTNSAGLINPSALTYTASTSTTAIVPNNAGLAYSPGNWLVGSGSAKTINPGAYFRTLFTGPSCTLNFDVSANSTPLPQLYYRVDGVSWTQVTLAASIVLIMPSGTTAWPHHYLEVVVKSTSEWLNFGASQGGSRWLPQNAAITLTSITLAGGQSVSAPATLGQAIWFFGDSITEGYRAVNGNGTGTQDTDGSDAMLGWAFEQRHLLGAEVAVIGFGGAGINAGGALGVPSLPNSYGYLWSGQARSFAAAPDLIVINYGENDGSSVGDATFITSYKAVLNGLLSATPATTRIACLVPFSQKKAADITSAIAGVGSARVSKIDTAGMFSTSDSADGQHPYGGVNLGVIAPQLANKLRPLLQGVRSRWSHS